MVRAYDVKEVDFIAWLDVLDEIRNPSDDDFTQMPALKILDFYKDVQATARVPVDADTSSARRSSKTIRELGPITESLMGLWIKQWNF